MLTKLMTNKFGARFTPNGRVVFRGDARRDGSLTPKDELSEIGVNVGADEYPRLPDVIISVAEHDWLVLMQAASSRGPIDDARRDELRSILGDADLVYVSCFTTRAELRDYPTDFAWGSSVWCADEPDHLIHFGGGRLLGPYEASPSAALRS